MNRRSVLKLGFLLTGLVPSLGSAAAPVPRHLLPPDGHRYFGSLPVGAEFRQAGDLYRKTGRNEDAVNAVQLTGKNKGQRSGKGPRVIVD